MCIINEQKTNFQKNNRNVKVYSQKKNASKFTFLTSEKCINFFFLESWIQARLQNLSFSKLSKKLASLGILEAQLRAPWIPYYDSVVMFEGEPSIRDSPETPTTTVLWCSRVALNGAHPSPRVMPVCNFPNPRSKVSNIQNN